MNNAKIRPADRCYHISAQTIIYTQFLHWLLGIAIGLIIQIVSGIIPLTSTYQPFTLQNVINYSVGTGFVIAVAIFAMVFVANGNNRVTYFVGALSIISLYIPFDTYIPGVLTAAPIMILILSVIGIIKLYIDLHPSTWNNYRCSNEVGHRQAYLTYFGAIVVGLVLILIL